ncbi:hypothetical protein RUND412_008224 [Rhizina undulata]
MTTSNPFRRKPLGGQGLGAQAAAPARPESRAVEGLSEEVLKELFGEGRDASTIPRSTTSFPSDTQKQTSPQEFHPQKRNSSARSQNRISDVELQTPDEHSDESDPFNSNPSSDSESEPSPSPPPAYTSIRHDPSQMRPTSINPFMRSHSPNPSPTHARRSMDMSDLRPSPTTFPSSSSYSSSGIHQKATARQSLDVDAFKQLMLTGQAPPLTVADRVDSGSTDTSSVSRQSIFKPIPEAESLREEEATPRTSHELEFEEDERAPPAIRNLEPKDRSSSAPSARPKPPPPKPRSRSGGKPTPGPSSTSTPPSPAIRKRTLEKLQPPPPPPPPISKADEVPPQKKTAPSPPLSRRQSTRSQTNPRVSVSPPLERPSTPSGGAGKLPPPPPPIRRLRSISKRPVSMAGHERSASVSSGILPPPPPPPPRKKSEDETTTSGSLVMEKLPLESDSDPGNVDILVDLEKLQREVDALRGKYERGGETKN